MKRTSLYILMASAFLALPAFGTAIGTIDSACDPTLTTPAAHGCTWYDFSLSAETGQPFGSGSSFTNYYVQAGTAQWTIANTTNYYTLRVLDGGHQGDTFNVFDNSVLLGVTSATTIDANHNCANDLSGAPGNDPAACWDDPLMSRGTFLLGPSGIGHSINITWNQRVPGGDSTIQFFEVNTASAPVGVPEPASIALFGSGLIGLALFRRKRSQKS